MADILSQEEIDALLSATEGLDLCGDSLGVYWSEQGNRDRVAEAMVYLDDLPATCRELIHHINELEDLIEELLDDG